MLRRLALLVCLVPTLVAASDRNPDRMVREIGRTLQSEAYAPGVDFSRWPQVAKQHRGRFLAAKTDDELAAALTTALQAFGTSHLSVFTPEFMKDPFVFKGAGVITAYFTEREVNYVWRVFPKSPADKAGVRPGDVVISQENLYTGIDGTPAVPSTLKVRRGTKEIEFKLNPAPYEMFPNAELDWISTSTAVLSIPTFTPAYNPARVEKLIGEASVAQNLILDLRYNGGGKPWFVEHLLGFFLPDRAPIGSFVGRADRRKFERLFPKGSLSSLAKWSSDKLLVKRQGKPYAGRVVVLINGTSGSAAEVTALAMQEIGKIPVFGEPSAGAVLVSDGQTLSGGFELLFPRFDYVSAKGRRLEGSPVKPNVAVLTTDVGWLGSPDQALRRVAQYLETVSSIDRKRENKTSSRA